MAYSDYGAFVYCNGVRREDKEDVALFATDEETFGTASENIPSGARLWVAMAHDRSIRLYHGVMGDGSIRVACYKQGSPAIYEATDEGVNEIEYAGEDEDPYDYCIDYEYKDYKFHFESDKPYEAQMIEPDGTVWECSYDYEYGAGF